MAYSFIDVSGEIEVNKRIFPIHPSATHKIMDCSMWSRCKLVCRICGDEGIFAINAKQLFLIAPFGARRHIFDHLIEHRFSKYMRGVDAKYDGYFMEALDVCAVADDTEFMMCRTNITPLFDENIQLLMITKIDNNHNEINLFHEEMFKEFELMSHGFDGERWGLISENGKNFKLGYFNQIMTWNFACVFCGEEYEGGLPSVEMVAMHITGCIQVLESNDIEYDSYHTFTSKDWNML